MFNQLLSNIDNIELWAETDKKENRGDFKLYYSAVHPENNFILMKNGADTVVAISYMPSIFFTSNPAFCEETEKWIESIINESLLIIGSSTK
jgi:hypothetical protein